MNTIQKLISSTILTAALVASTGVFAQEEPVVDIGHRHPHLREAQRLARKAYNKISEAQTANEWDMGGHAQHAKDLLDQVDVELKAAAEDANAHR